MAVESVQVNPPGDSPIPRQQYWCRLQFQKAGDLRLVSHIDLLHVFERLMRRAGLPFASTQGFHPKPCLAFAQALALGVAGLNEMVDLALRESLPAAEVLERLNRHAPPGLEFLACRALERKSSVQVRRAFYRLPLTAVESPEMTGLLGGLAARCAELIARDRCLVERLRPQRRFVNVRPYLCELEASYEALTFALWITPDGAARPDEIVKALGLAPLLDAGAVLERTRVELMDEMTADQRWLPAIPRLVDAAITPEEMIVPATAEMQSRAEQEALIESPMSYET
jgi:radical SAM-linked protein